MDAMRPAPAPGPDIPFSRPDSRTMVIGISSGKGGVGKSTVTTNVAAAMALRGHSVGVMDADIWGFSIPRMFGLRGQRPSGSDGMIEPLERNGVKVISIGFFLEREEDPLMFRGPMLHKALEQFLTDIRWGDDLDYLLIDLPPGTGDIVISLATFLPAMGMVVVTTPQPVAQKVAERAANGTNKVKLRVLGVVENMAGEIFGSGGGGQLAETLGVPLYGSIPLIPELRESSDAGEPFVWTNPDHPVTQSFLEIGDALTKFRPRRRLSVSGTGGRGGNGKPRPR
ncbi:MAG TPA: Mrp/NBP35 family ATP-binding protein [Actinomycetota bacterium]|nr:Mrp/NBP35 family ATP-binding protein [Actinomycetota bacterium]